MPPALHAFLAQSAEPPLSQSTLFQVLPIVAIGIVFYFLLIRPQRRQAKAHRELIASLKKGDEVVMLGGMLGTIHSVEDRTVTLDLVAGTRVRAARANVVGLWVEKPAAGVKPGT